MALKPKGLLIAAGLALVAVGVTAGAIFAQQAPAKPDAAIQIVAVPGNAADPNAIIGVNGLGKKVAEGTSGLANVSVDVPVTLGGGSTNPSQVKAEKFAWTLTAPPNSKATLSATNQATVKFTPDVSGVYKVDLVVSNAAGSGAMDSVQIHAGQYIGVTGGNCVQCHPGVTNEWAKTAHALLFQEQINGQPNPAIAEYGKESEGCVRCHTTGYYIGAKNGGYPDAVAQTGYQLPPNADVQAGKDNWSLIPDAVKNMATIGCEDCHGPAKDHVQNNGKMEASLDEGVCNQCHNGGGHHIKGAEFQNSAHSDKFSDAWTHPVGPEEQACVRCHSGKGFISFLKNPTEQASWDSSFQNATCGVCHDPHSEANPAQLRIVGKPVEVVGLTKDFGESAVCVECHNGRRDASGAQKGSYPHYSTAAEMMANTGGVTYGQTVSDSPHGLIVGMAKVPNPDAEAAAETPFLFAGGVPGPCVICHMTATPSDAKDPNRYMVGGHSFNTANPKTGFDYTAACQSCHPGTKTSDLIAKADYDGNGKVEGVQEEVAGLLNLLQKAIGDSGIKP
ncbi:MAG TPA: cytochrome c3 family protein, partial [Chloroflexota bacterium]